MFRFEMKSTISILLFFALPFVIYGGKVSEKYSEEVDKIDNLAKNGTKINNALLLKSDGFLGEGNFGFVYEGIIIEENRSVAIKFVKNKHIESCEDEMAMYSYLKAYRNASVEKYGIPVVYYYDRWQNYILMAFTKFDMELFDVANDFSDFSDNPLNILMLLRDFVFQSKYLHSHGVRHDDIKPENIMIRGHRSYLIDFNTSSKMMDDNRGGTREYVCKRYATGAKRRAIDDYESFIYTISAVMYKDWFKPEYDDNKSRKDELVNDGLEQIIKAFADEVFTDDASKKFPDYNNLEKMISEEIKRIHPNGEPKFSWVSTDAETSPERNIADIAEPTSFNFTEFVYPPTVLHASGQAKQPSVSPATVHFLSGQATQTSVSPSAVHNPSARATKTSVSPTTVHLLSGQATQTSVSPATVHFLSGQATQTSVSPSAVHNPTGKATKTSVSPTTVLNPSRKAIHTSVSPTTVHLFSDQATQLCVSPSIAYPSVSGQATQPSVYPSTVLNPSRQAIQTSVYPPMMHIPTVPATKASIVTKKRGSSKKCFSCYYMC